MKNLGFVFMVLMICSTAFSKSSDQHSTIYTKKIKRIINAVNLGDFLTESAYMEMLQIACNRNSCSETEKETIQSVGSQILNCKIKHLKVHGIENPDAVAICNSSNAMIGCDSLPSSLLRKMCYTGNHYSLQVLKNKESRLNNRVPASE